MGDDAHTTAGEYRGSDPCSLANAVQVVGERWTFFILREALMGTTRFSEFRRRLGIASDVLTARLDTLVGAGIMARREYREPGQRPRADYHLTDAGRELSLSVLALQQWGDVHTPSRTPTSVAFRSPAGRAVTVAFVDQDGVVLEPADVELVRLDPSAPAAPSG
ncbi:winged helix-turn-helix transcriptional regulator [Modestobacter sp. SSW1-42]|uniref:winged helix-turn-helix transcriptional regulator n=1 Tax=Modestobacter sp. SSW1-42 TaxID=596372 RepID=UPI003985A45B